MFRNQYDTDVTTWSPQGRLHQVYQRKVQSASFLSLIQNLMQVEYAMEAVKQGSACVGVRSRTHAVLVALKRAHNDMSSYQKKVSVQSSPYLTSFLVSELYTSNRSSRSMNMLGLQFQVRSLHPFRSQTAYFLVLQA
jgi:hypothetical protein